MIPYGLTKNFGLRVHPHNVCEVCCSFVGKKEGRSKARQRNREEIRKLENEYLPS